MEKIRQINSDRIRWCIDDFGIAPEELAERLNIAPERFSGVLTGSEGMTFNQLRAMAQFFGRGVLFFLEPGRVNEISVRTPAFRSLSNEKPDLSPEVKRLIERAERHREVYLTLREELGADDLPRFNPPEVKGNEPGLAAAKMRTWLGLENDPAATRDFAAYREAVEAKGILVLRSMGYVGGWQFPKNSSVIGFSLFFDICPLIVVRKQAAEPRQTFTLMHELGHLILHRRSSIDVEANLWAWQGHERQANAFAGYLLVPDSFLEAIRTAVPADVAGYDDWLTDWRTTWGVSSEVILRRLLDTARLTQAQYDRYRAWRKARPAEQPEEGGSRMYRHREPIHIFGQRYVRTVLDALSGNYITLNKASGFLDNLKITDVRQLEKHVARV
jgi:Zn-dependent peptidase ImmA (M78 family)